MTVNAFDRGVENWAWVQRQQGCEHRGVRYVCDSGLDGSDPRFWVGHETGF